MQGSKLEKFCEEHVVLIILIAVLGIFIFVAAIDALDVWFKRSILGAPYCISGEGK